MFTKRTAGFLAVAAGLVFTTAHADYYRQSNNNTIANVDQTTNQDKATNASDEQLNRRIRQNIRSLINNGMDIVLITSNGIVTIEGTVNNSNDQQRLIAIIQNMDGVKSVKSNLRKNNSH